ncbi:sulfatase [bacterium]|nr:sulfatase [bacterium]
MINLILIGIISGVTIGAGISLGEILSQHYIPNETFRLALMSLSHYTTKYLILMFCAIIAEGCFFRFCHTISHSKKNRKVFITDLVIANIPLTAVIIYFLADYNQSDFKPADILHMFFSSASAETHYPFASNYLPTFVTALAITACITPLFYLIIRRLTMHSAFKQHLLRTGAFCLAVFVFIKGLDTFVRYAYKPSSPNIVIIVIDTLRADHLPFYGYHRNTAPFLSRLAEQGVLFNNAYACSSWTAPSTASLFTSYYPFQHGVLTGMRATERLSRDSNTMHINKIPNQISTIAEILKDKGYDTFGISDNLNICEAEGFTQGFDYFETYHYEGGKAVNEKLKEWTPRIKKGKFFLYVHYMDPHKPYHRHTPWFTEQETPLQNAIAAYDSEINYVDTMIKDVFDMLSFNTGAFVIITSDHGEAFEEHGHSGHGKSLYNEEIHIPLILYFPEKNYAGTIDQNISLVDIVPTISYLIGNSPDKSREGTNLIALIDNDSSDTGRPIYVHLLNKKPGGKETIKEVETFAVLRHEWKYLRQNTVPPLLFNRKEDPSEHINMIDREKDLAFSLQAILDDFLSNCRRFTQTFHKIQVFRKQYEHLKSLGYIH